VTIGQREKSVLAAGLAGLAVIGVLLTLSAAARSEGGFAVRMVKLVGDPGAKASREHVRFCRQQGFNALWVYSQEAGEWTKERAPNGPALDPAFLRLARWCRWHGMDVWVSINPPADAEGRFVFTDPDDERRLVAFITMLRKKAGVRRIVLSFDDLPRELHELSDIFRYGLSTAPAHLDLVLRVAAALPPDVALWLCASAYCDAHLADGVGLYSKPFLAGLPALPASIGIVWTGPKVLSPKITRGDLEATRARLGGRPLLLYDNFPVNDDHGDTMALILGALRGREAGIRDVVAAYLACPERPLAGSRLSLLTTADFLRDPEGYDPDASAHNAIAKLSGRNPEAATALRTQQLEWGGFIEERNYWPRDEMNPVAAADRLMDPAFVESFTWTAARYPIRMAAIEGLADGAFRDDLLQIMGRRLVIARAMPLTVDYLARVRAGRSDADAVLARIVELRRSSEDDLDAARILDLFLGEAGVPMDGPR
jgi:hypothetical protein